MGIEPGHGLDHGWRCHRTTGLLVTLLPVLVFPTMIAACLSQIGKEDPTVGLWLLWSSCAAALATVAGMKMALRFWDGGVQAFRTNA